MTTRKSAASNSITVEMTLSKQTKGTFVYSADDDDAAVTTVYVRKSGFTSDPPDEITLTITV